MKSSFDMEVCGSVGPQIGSNDSKPRCARYVNHPGLHRGFAGSGYEKEQWGQPTFPDLTFRKEYQGYAEG